MSAGGLTFASAHIGPGVRGWIGLRQPNNPITPDPVALIPDPVGPVDVSPPADISTNVFVDVSITYVSHKFHS